MKKFFNKKRRRTVAITMATVLCSLVFFGEKEFLPANADEDIVMQIVAHRGYSSAYPENTLSAFAGAYACGANTVEFDVRKSKDNELVIFHDDTLEKINGETKSVADYSYSQLYELDDGKWFSKEFAKERIPTLDDTLSLLQSSGMRMFVELKDIGDDPDFAREVYEKVESYGLLDKAIFLSFKYDYLQQIKEINPDQPIMVLASFGKSTLPTKYPADYYGINMKTLTPRTIKAIHDAGSRVYCYTPETRGQILALQRMGVDGIITDYPEMEKLEM
ncbi:MAG: hypothetical protein K6E79_08735 [Pseudobutyrivibrio sp.]|nr:hypothetical protein [Pseudobutyrivibrio sp.]